MVQPKSQEAKSFFYSLNTLVLRSVQHYTMVGQRTKGDEFLEIERRKIELEEQLLDLQERRIDLEQKRIQLELRKIKLLIKTFRRKSKGGGAQNARDESDEATTGNARRLLSRMDSEDSHFYSEGNRGGGLATSDEDEDEEDDTEEDEAAFAKDKKIPLKSPDIPNGSSVKKDRATKRSSWAREILPLPPNRADKPRLAKRHSGDSYVATGSREKSRNGYDHAEGPRRHRVGRRGSAPSGTIESDTPMEKGARDALTRHASMRHVAAVSKKDTRRSLTPVSRESTYLSTHMQDSESSMSTESVQTEKRSNLTAVLPSGPDITPSYAKRSTLTAELASGPIITPSQAKNPSELLWK